MKICSYCGSELDKHDRCTNPECIGCSPRPKKKKRKAGRIIGLIILFSFLAAAAYGCYYLANNWRDLPIVQEILHDKPAVHHTQSNEDIEYTELKSCLGTDIKSITKEVTDVYLMKTTDQSVEYGNQSVMFRADPGANEISAIYVFERCGYTIYGVHIGMKFADAEKLLEEAGFEKSFNRADETEYLKDSREKAVVYQNKKIVSEIDLFIFDGSEKEPEKTTDKPSDVSEVSSFTRATSSSALAPYSSGTDTFTYYAANVLDDDPTTCWTEGVIGAGTGETITLRSDKEETVKGLHIVNGYCKSEKLYHANNRLKEIKVTFSDGSSEFLTLKDGYENRTADLDFSKEVTTKQIKIEIISVHYGADKADTCVSDISVY